MVVGVCLAGGVGRVEGGKSWGGGKGLLLNVDFAMGRLKSVESRPSPQVLEALKGHFTVR